MKSISNWKLGTGLAAAAAVVTLGLAPIEAQAQSEQENPGLKVGDKAPYAVVKTIDGKKMPLSTLYGDGPVVVTFYRGGWCPFCNKALKAWGDALPAIDAAGATWVGITPQNSEGIESTQQSVSGDYSIYSDYDLKAAKAFGIFFNVSDETQSKYKGYGINLNEENANGQWQLPHPSTFIIDSKGIIRFAEVHVDYKQRTDPQDVLAALENIN